MSANPEPKLYPLEEVEARLALSRRAIEKLIAVGRLRSVKVGRRRFVRDVDLREFIEQLLPTH